MIFINAYRLCDIHKLGLSLANQARAGAVWHTRNLGIIDMKVQLPDTIIDIFLKKINFFIVCRGVEYYTVYLGDGTMAMTGAIFWSMASSTAELGSRLSESTFVLVKLIKVIPW